MGPFVDDLPPEVDGLIRRPTTFRHPRQAIYRTTTELLTAIELEIGLNNATLTNEERLSEIQKRVDGPNVRLQSHEHLPDPQVSYGNRCPPPRLEKTTNRSFMDSLFWYRWVVLEEHSRPDSLAYNDKTFADLKTLTNNDKTFKERVKELEWELELDGCGTIADRICLIEKKLETTTAMQSGPLTSSVVLTIYC